MVKFPLYLRCVEMDVSLLKLSVLTTSPASVSCVLVSYSDLQSFESVAWAAAEVSRISKVHGGLDVLLNNAGVMAQPDIRTGDGYDVQMQVNHLSHFLLTSLLMPSLEEGALNRGGARIVQHSSGARRSKSRETGHLEGKYFEPQAPGALGGDGIVACLERYHQSKLSNAVFAMALHRRLHARGNRRVKSLVAEPGISSTSLFENIRNGHKQAEGAAQATLSTAANAALLNYAMPFYFQHISPLFDGVGGGGPQSAADGAACLITAGFHRDAYGGDFFMPSLALRPLGSRGMPSKCIARGSPSAPFEWQRQQFQNEALTTCLENQEQLWTSSESAVGAFFGRL
jgi:NAD(P)-dependent dehydrogenase (short-subunit alcohol dehydrogenase family)